MAIGLEWSDLRTVRNEAVFPCRLCRRDDVGRRAPLWREARLNATVLAEETGVPLPTAQKLVSRLSAAGLIESARGTGGGFRLSRPPSAISLADIVEAVEGPIALTACVDHGSGDCCIEGNCRVKPHWNVVNGAVRGALAGVRWPRLLLRTPAQAESWRCER